jgi:hypothetical protein
VAFCESRAIRPDALSATRDTAADWLACIADVGTLKASSIAGYRSAAGTWWAEQTRCGGANPFQHEHVSRVVKGIRNALRPARSVIAAEVKPVLLTVSLLHLLEGALREGGSSRGTLVWAVCCLGVSALPRPNELFGRAAGALHRTPPQLSSITFYDVGGAAIRACDTRADRPTMPNRFAWDLGATKADPDASRSIANVAADYAVRALWAWCCHRAEVREFHSDLFRIVNAGSTITQHAVLRALEAAHVAQDLGPAVFQGKCFRQGGAASLIGSGIAVADVMASGRWASSAMPLLYGGAEAAVLRQLHVSAATDTGAASRSAARSFGAGVGLLGR